MYAGVPAPCFCSAGVPTPLPTCVGVLSPHPCAIRVPSPLPACAGVPCPCPYDTGVLGLLPACAGIPVPMAMGSPFCARVFPPCPSLHVHSGAFLTGQQQWGQRQSPCPLAVPTAAWGTDWDKSDAPQTLGTGPPSPLLCQLFNLAALSSMQEGARPFFEDERAFLFIPFFPGPASKGR